MLSLRQLSLALIVGLIALASLVVPKYADLTALANQTGSQVRKLNASLPPGTRIEDPYGFSPDGAFIVYIVSVRDEYDRTSYDLYSVPVSGGQATRIYAGRRPSSEYYTFEFTPDSKQVIIAGSDGIYNVSITGGSAIRLGDFGTFDLSPDGQTVVSCVYDRTANRSILYRTPIIGGTSIDLVTPGCNQVKISPDGNWVVFDYTIRRGDTSFFDPALGSIPLTGGTARHLNASISAPIVAYGNSQLEVSPDSRYVLFEVRSAEQTSRLYSVPIGGGDPVDLLGPVDLGEGSTFTFTRRFTPDGRYVLATDPLTADRYRVPTAGGAKVKLNRDVPGFALFAPIQVTPDGQFMILESANPLGFHSIPIMGGAPIRISEDWSYSSIFTSDSQKLVYANAPIISVASLDGNPVRQVATNAFRAETEPLLGTYYDTLRVTPDNSQVLYTGRNSGSNIQHLFSVPIAGGEPIQVNGPLIEDGQVLRYLISPDGAVVVYLANAEELDRFELYLAPIPSDPTLALNFQRGAPGSSFLIEARGFPPGLRPVVTVNGVRLDLPENVIADGIGRWRLHLRTPLDGLPGRYRVAVATPGGRATLAQTDVLAIISYELVSSGPDGVVRAAPSNAPDPVAVPTSIRPQQFTFLPLTQR